MEIISSNAKNVKRYMKYWIKFKENKRSSHILMLIFAICILGAMSTWAKEKDSDSSNYEHGGSIWEVDNIALLDNDVAPLSA